MTKLRISPDLSLPIEIAGEAVGVLATRGAGKSYTSAALVEELWRAKVQFAVLDPTGVYWGLRASADGRSKDGLSVVILGGPHGDLPLEPTAGKLIADVLVDTGQSLVLDLSDFETKAAQNRFVTDLAERLYPRKARARTTLHLIVDEGDEFCPQKPMRDEARMLGAMERIVRRGRSRGIGVTLITQRSAALNKNVLDVVDTLVAMRMGSPRDRKAVEEWITAKHERDELGVLDSLPGLPTGTAWVWSPVRGILKRVAVRRIRTFDSYATPKPGEKRAEPRELAPIDLDRLGKEMEATKERVKAEDPKELRRQLAEARREIAGLQRQGPRTEVETRVETVVERVEVPVFRDGEVSRLTAAVGKLEEVGAELVAVAREVGGALVRVGEVQREKGRAVERQPAARPAPARTGRPMEQAGRLAARPVPPAPVPPGTGALVKATIGAGKTLAGPPYDHTIVPDDLPQVKAGARRMLEVLAQQHPMRLTRAGLGMAAKVKRTGGTFSTYFGVLKGSGLIEEGPDGLVGITEAGLDYLGIVPAMPLSPEELRRLYRERLKAGARRMFDELVAAYPDGVSREDLAERAGIAQTGGTFSTYLGHLRANELVSETGGMVYAADWLFEGAT